MLNVLPRDFSSLLCILFCNAVPGVGGQFVEFLMTKIQNVRVGTWMRRKQIFSSTLKVCLRARESITIVIQQVKVIFASIWIQRLLLPNILMSLFYFNLLFLGETITDIARRLLCDTGVVSLARFPTGRAVIAGIEWIAEVTAFR